MKNSITKCLFILLICGMGQIVWAQQSIDTQCLKKGPVLQILGSGGPFGSGRASASYLIWVDGRSQIMVDAGGGSFAHFHEAGAKLADIQLLALSHFHPDHVAEVPALLWPQSGTLRVAGPSGTAAFPSLDEFLDGLFGPTGVFRVLNQRFEFEAITVDPTDHVKNSDAAAGVEIYRDETMRISAMAVPHGDVPALAYRIDIGEASIAFSSDQNGSNHDFIEFVRDVDVLVVHFAGNEDGTGRPDLHAKPSTWGQIATQAQVGRLVLSHLSTNQNFQANLGFLQAEYSGPLTVAEDLLCVTVD